ncbi:dimethyl sulfoxide reductase anchor subunit [Paraburkholderia bonniea]|uniref:dimethyl sulfoxide reductase anchor subunit family protein n=1 Tax=Paraburkholderia bonniea TaxID=2152891 RepID=UPI0012926229|nr:DmsC/YnfH family molybdoenzyme membrane anchor subunit [Paraburkholderia bonniea]WJF90441.1 dimethyl sulfoxide reductase anchor subunit [Paraburkholderia bonniea]WJF93756.1 dimethyl sulfoxide reductase anchor subunit [Paraburkholderia bonniea]
MNPAFSVVFLTTLSGAAQGLLIALVGVDCATRLGLIAASAAPQPMFFVIGAALSVVLASLGLLASFFHLGHPERAWRAIAMWRTSWLSRECLCLPAFLACAFAYGVAHWFALPWALAAGLLGVLASAGLFVCTAMIYACLRFLQEWATPLTLVNFVLLGCASGFTLATASTVWFAPGLTVPLAVCACLLTAAGCVSRSVSLVRNARLRPKSTVQSATGIQGVKVVQTSRGFTAGAFNLREFFHGKAPGTLRKLKWAFLAGAFAVPFTLVALAASVHSVGLSALLLCTACAVQYAGLVTERWFFFAEARHPQNLYYAQVS